jgi:hypothetical protein
VTAFELVEAGELDVGSEEDLSAPPHPALTAPTTTMATAQPATRFRSTSTHDPSKGHHRCPASTAAPDAAGETLV